MGLQVPSRLRSELKALEARAEGVEAIMETAWAALLHGRGPAGFAKWTSNLCVPFQDKKLNNMVR